MIPFANIDIEFAKEQLILFLREWYMHPNGQVCPIVFIICHFDGVLEIKRIPKVLYMRALQVGHG